MLMKITFVKQSQHGLLKEETHEQVLFLTLLCWKIQKTNVAMSMLITKYFSSFDSFVFLKKKFVI
jgi:hypothetical protein